eukprot:gnl/TRDRNA2_/TRDRNA2_28412_c0_seq1.p1 gnl/TRDRNA2_/TRDRNA2_28412_c0~~gnl/TRDRNA2_/TRDRNA2_28412_c0_seq1.p1  ORF type:complete len:611 (-),score=68.55 gnl/TRDRNA2_/TRDRNA2_28412_c0_seq1:242-2017(-)
MAAFVPSPTARSMPLSTRGRSSSMCFPASPRVSFSSAVVPSAVSGSVSSVSMLSPNAGMRVRSSSFVASSTMAPSPTSRPSIGVTYAASSPIAMPAAKPLTTTTTVVKTSWADITDTPHGTSKRARPSQLSFHLDSRNTTPNHSPVPSDSGTPRKSPSKLQEFEALPRHVESDEESMEDYGAAASYPTSPHGPRVVEAYSGAEPRIGIDIGGVLTRDGDPSVSKDEQWGVDWEAPDALEACRRLVEVFGSKNVFLVSKVRPGGSMQRKTEHWLHEVVDFCNFTGVPKESIVFVGAVDGPNGKGPAALQLGLSHFVDDKLQVLESVFSDTAGNSGHLVERHQGILFHFAKGGALKSAPQGNLDDVAPRMRKHVHGVANWREVLGKLREKLPSALKKQGYLELLTLPDRTSANGDGKKDFKGMRSSPPPWSQQTAASRDVPPPWHRSAGSTATAPAVQHSAGGRPKLVLKPRTEQAPASIAVTSVTSKVSTYVPSSPTHRPLSPKGAPSVVTVPQPAAPALQRDPAGGRPKLMLKPRSSAAVRTSSPVASITTRAVSPTAATRFGPAPAAVQPNPAGGRPKLVLKPRTLPLPS